MARDPVVNDGAKPLTRRRVVNDPAFNAPNHSFAMRYLPGDGARGASLIPLGERARRRGVNTRSKRRPSPYPLPRRERGFRALGLRRAQPSRRRDLPFFEFHTRRACAEEQVPLGKWDLRGDGANGASLNTHLPLGERARGEYSQQTPTLTLPSP